MMMGDMMGHYGGMGDYGMDMNDTVGNFGGMGGYGTHMSDMTGDRRHCWLQHSLVWRWQTAQRSSIWRQGCIGCSRVR